MPFFGIIQIVIHEIRDCQLFFTICVNNKYMEKFGERLKELRTEKEISQKQLGELFGVSGNTIHAWETDKQEPPLLTVVKLSDYFNVSCDYLLGKADY